MALVTTACAFNTDSYVTLDEADDYIVDQLIYDSAEWEDLEDGQKEFRLKTAALLINTLPLRGAKACRDQRLEFPRWWRTDDGYPYYEDTYLTSSDILSAGYSIPSVPDEVKFVQAEISFHIVHNGILKMESMAYPEREIKAFGLGGSLEIEFTDRPSTNKAILDKARLSTLDVAYYLIHKWLMRVSGGVI